MKQIIALLFAGFIGGTLSFFLLRGELDSKVVTMNESPRAVLVSNDGVNDGVVTQPFNFVTAAEKVTPAVVHIEATQSAMLASQERKNKRRNRPSSPFGQLFDMEEFFGPQFFGPKNGTGSGVIISEDGYIVTNDHVVGYADKIMVSLSDKRQFQAIKIGTDPSTDLALLKIEATGLASVNFADSDEVKVGEWVAAVGNPFSYLKSTVTAGIVSAKGRDIDIIKGEKAIEEFIQTDAAINPGNSGGALVNIDGGLIGINTAIATPTGVYAGYSFAIPANLVKTIVAEIKEGGDIQRARLGVQGDSVDKDWITERKLTVDAGFFVAKLEPGGAAQMAGVLPGDVIIRANGQSIENYDDLATVMEFAKVGDTVELVVQRKKQTKDIKVRLRKGI